MGGLLLDWTVVAVQDTEAVEAEVAITTRLASMKASWKLYRHFFFAPLFFCSLASEEEEEEDDDDDDDEEEEEEGGRGVGIEGCSPWGPMDVVGGRCTSGRGGPSMSPVGKTNDMTK